MTYDGCNNTAMDIIEAFFKAYWKPGMKYVYTEKVPKEMMLSEVDEDGWYEWKPIPGTLNRSEYKKIEDKFHVAFPDSFIEWHRRYFFADGDCSIVRLPESFPTRPLEKLIENLDWFIAEQLIPQGLIPFANDGNDGGPLVFDTRNKRHPTDFPIRFYDHEYGGDLDGLSEVIFSSFDSLLACLIHLLNRKTRRIFEVIPDFYQIDPMGAGSTGKRHWESWVEMEKENDRSQ